MIRPVVINTLGADQHAADAEEKLGAVMNRDELPIERLADALEFFRTVTLQDALGLLFPRQYPASKPHPP